MPWGMRGRGRAWQERRPLKQAVSILLECILVIHGNIANFYRPQRSCGQGYVFTRVCDSVHGGGVGVFQAGRTPSPAGRTPPPGTRQTPPGWKTPPRDQEDPPRDQADPPREADFRMRSTSGRYASYCLVCVSENTD